MEHHSILQFVQISYLYYSLHSVNEISTIFVLQSTQFLWGGGEDLKMSTLKVHLRLIPLQGMQNAGPF